MAELNILHNTVHVLVKQFVIQIEYNFITFRKFLFTIDYLFSIMQCNYMKSNKIFPKNQHQLINPVYFYEGCLHKASLLNKRIFFFEKTILPEKN